MVYTSRAKWLQGFTRKKIESKTEVKGTTNGRKPLLGVLVIKALL